MVRVPVRREMLEWACKRAGLTAHSFAEQHPQSKLPLWLGGEVQPTLRQLEEFATATHTSVGALLLPKPMDEPLPIADFRSGPKGAPSADLLDTIYLCQQRQDWYREHARLYRLDEVAFIASASPDQNAEEVAERMRTLVGIRSEERRAIPTWSEALRTLIERVEAAGVLVMVSGVVGSNNRRKLNPQEFRGFAFSDTLAPVIFVNGSDTKAAQIFTLAHEVGHLALGESALSDATARVSPSERVERWCNQFAAEFLVPRAEIDAITGDDIQSLARHFKVSTLVVLRRLFDLRRMSQEQYWTRFDAELERLRGLEARGTGGGNFYYTTMARAGKRLTRALVTSALEGQGSFSEALHLLGFRKMTVFDELARMVGVAG